MVNFENGTLVKGAYVVINGTEYPVVMPEYSGNTPISAENMNKIQNDILQVTFPIGSMYVTQTNTNPNEILGFGTWERLKGKLCVGLDENDSDFDTIGKTGGKKTQELRALIGACNGNTVNIGYQANNAIAGQGYTYSVDGTQTSNIGYVSHTTTVLQHDGKTPTTLQPYEVVGYIWIRRT